MKKKYLKWVIVIVLITIFCVSLYNDSVFEFLPGKTDFVSFYDGAFQDYTDFEKYTFKASKRLTKKLENHKYLKPVKNEDIEHLTGIIENFGLWIEDKEIYTEFDLDISCVDEEDYFYIEKEDIIERDDGRKWYGYYDLYYFDTQSMQGYFMHNNI